MSWSLFFKCIIEYFSQGPDKLHERIAGEFEESTAGRVELHGWMGGVVPSVFGDWALLNSLE